MPIQNLLMQQSLYNFFYGSLLFLSIVLAVLIIKYISCKDKKIEDTDNREEASYNKALKILEQARFDSLKILTDSQKKAHAYLISAKDLTKDNKDKLTKKLEDIYQRQQGLLKETGNEFLESYKAALEKNQQENIQTLASTTELFKKEVLEEVADLKDTLKKETIESQNVVKEKVRASYEEVEKEISEYKEKKLKEVDKQILEILAEIYADIIGKNLDAVDYEDLVLQMLEEELKKANLR